MFITTLYNLLSARQGGPWWGAGDALAFGYHISRVGCALHQKLKVQAHGKSKKLMSTFTLQRVHCPHVYIENAKEKLCRMSCWNVPESIARTSPDILQGRPESQCYGERWGLIYSLMGGWLFVVFCRLLAGEQISPLPSQARRRI